MVVQGVGVYGHVLGQGGLPQMPSVVLATQMTLRRIITHSWPNLYEETLL